MEEGVVFALTFIGLGTCITKYLGLSYKGLCQIYLVTNMQKDKKDEKKLTTENADEVKNLLIC